MYDYLRGMIDYDIDVALRHDTPFLIQGTLLLVDEGYLVVRHGSGSDYVVPFASIKYIKVEGVPLSETQ